MLNRHEAREDRNPGQDMPPRDAAPIGDRPRADREVPLPGTAAADGPALMLHQWLDGEASEADARRIDAKQVQLWTMIAAETGQRRHVKMPPLVTAHIMAAIADVRPEAQTATAAATTVRTIVEPRSALPMTMVMMLGAGLFAIGIVIGKML